MGIDAVVVVARLPSKWCRMHDPGHCYFISSGATGWDGTYMLKLN
jgi:hypothetical protein